MAVQSGKLGVLDVPVSTDAVLYQCGSGTTAVAATINVAFCNRTTTDVRVRLAVAAANTPVAAEYLEYETSVPAYGVLERSGIVVSAGERVIVRADTAGISARAHGFEK